MIINESVAMHVIITLACACITLFVIFIKASQTLYYGKFWISIGLRQIIISTTMKL